MDDETKELIKEMKEYRDGMVARNLPFQWISDIITKWEMKQIEDTCTCGRSPTGNCIGWHVFLSPYFCLILALFGDVSRTDEN